MRSKKKIMIGSGVGVAALAIAAGGLVMSLPAQAAAIPTSPSVTSSTSVGTDVETNDDGPGAADTNVETNDDGAADTDTETNDDGPGAADTDVETNDDGGSSTGN